MFEFIFAFIVLGVNWPALLLITIWLCIANKGAEAIFTQECLKKNGKIFKVI